MKQTRKEEEARILREVFGDDYDRADTDAEQTSDPSTPPRAADKSGTSASEHTTDTEHVEKHHRFRPDDKIHCPRCRHTLKDRHGCPYCGYNGYIPMSPKQTMRIRLILFPIIIIAAVAVYFIFSR